MSLVDLTDYTEAWRCNETAGPLVGVNGTDIPEVNTVPDEASGGAVEDPPGNTAFRKQLIPIGVGSPVHHFRKAFSAGDIFDIRGKVSCTMALWVQLGDPAYPFAFSIHGERLNPGGANGQAFWLTVHDSNNSPRFFMLDGLSAFNSKDVHANSSVAVLPVPAWQFIAGGYDAARNKVFCAWGRQAGEFYYDEADGFAAGFGYDGTGTETGFGQFVTAGGGGPLNLDHAIWWKGRAVSQEGLNFLWNDHSGRALSDLVSDLGGDGSVAHNSHGQGGNAHGDGGN